ncbi:MAG: P-loop NTPase [Desulfatitalea sp.]|nr:P-loop NTPase [Desulfatitalea sp.]
MQASKIERIPAAGSRAKPTVIAIGGAKGGIGKSLIAANLAVYLASQNWRTVAVDLDLGAANLHLYLGVWSLQHRINDYLDKKFERLEQIAVETRFGPRLIGGGSSRLGAANLPFARKLKLMRAIQTLDADVVVVDLGGDTAYNVLDFYLQADHGIVMTSCDPASYLDAYTFVKMALHRRLTRLFGPENRQTADHKDLELLSLLNQFVGPDAMANGDKGSKITDLLDAVRETVPAGLPLVSRAIERFQPHLLVNMATDTDSAGELVQRFRKVARRMLSIDVPSLDHIPTATEIARSTRDLIPEAARNPDGALVQHLARIVNQLQPDLNPIPLVRSAAGR